jgi:hypothetical protein
MSKSELTKTLIDHLPDDHKITLKEALLHWYYNIRGNGGLRLTQHGLQAFKILGLESWSIPLTDLKKTISKSILLELDRKLMYPYYIDFKNKQLICYSSKEAMYLNLYPSLADFLKNYNQT